MIWRTFFILIGFLSASVACADIFGKDNRRAPKVGSVADELSQAVAVGVLSSLLEKKEDGNYKVFSDQMSDFMCKDEAFYDEPSISYACTGFLVGPDLLVTAGHCSTNAFEVFHSSELYCESYTWMFDYKINAQTQFNPHDVSPEKIFKCKEIIYAVSDSEEPYRDFALIRLERAVAARRPVEISFEEPKVGASVSMLGAPMGMPLKFADDAKVLENKLENQVFTTDLDAFSGNSGSPVFNAKNQAVGVLVAGSPSEATYKDKKMKCERYNFCDQNGENCKSSATKDLRGGFKNGSDIEKLSKYQELLNRYMFSSGN